MLLGREPSKRAATDLQQRGLDENLAYILTAGEFRTAVLDPLIGGGG
ncbi:MAG: hypothetical protein WDN44_05190 [Sphingomonas sp.]